MGVTIYLRLSDEEARLIKAVAGKKHNRWARHVLLKEAYASIPVDAIRHALEAAGFDELQITHTLARFK